MCRRMNTLAVSKLTPSKIWGVPVYVASGRDLRGYSLVLTRLQTKVIYKQAGRAETWRISSHDEVKLTKIKSTN